MLLVYAWQVRPGPLGWNETSRLAAVESLVERGTLVIDGSPFAEETFDKIRLGGRFYSDKPPLLQVLAAVPYAALRAAGLRLRPQACGAGEACAYRLLTLVVVGVPAALLVALFFRGLVAAGRGLAPAFGASVLLAGGTTLWPYSLVFNNHVPAAAAIFGAFVLLAGVLPGTGSRSAWAAGLLAGLAASFDLPSILLASSLGALALTRGVTPGLQFALGAGVPLGLTAMLDVAITGSPLPPYFATHGYEYPGSRLAATVAGLGLPRRAGEYAVEGLVGSRGLFSHAPVLLWGLWGWWRVARPPSADTLRTPARFLGVGALALLGYVLVFTDNHGGQAHGERFLLTLVPLLAFFWLRGLPAEPPRGLAARLSAAAFVLATGLSVLSALQGAPRVWKVTNTPLYFELRARAPYVAVCSNLADDCRGPRAPRP